VAPRRITNRKEFWAGPRQHKNPIGNFFVKLYETQPTVSGSRQSVENVLRIQRECLLKPLA
jgi:hypothetical protein